MEVIDSQPGLATVLGDGWELVPLGASGFCDTWQARRGRLILFVKSAGEAGAGMLRAEADGLRALKDREVLDARLLQCDAHAEPGEAGAPRGE